MVSPLEIVIRAYRKLSRQKRDRVGEFEVALEAVSIALDENERDDDGSATEDVVE